VAPASRLAVALRPTAFEARQVMDETVTALELIREVRYELLVEGLSGGVLS
jgi:hypothetical protein